MPPTGAAVPDPLLPDDDPEPGPVAVVVPTAVRPKHVICDFCQCKLAMDGGVLETGARARKFARTEDTTESMQSEIDSLRSQLSTAKERIASLEAPPAVAASRGPRY